MVLHLTSRPVMRVMLRRKTTAAKEAASRRVYVEPMSVAEKIAPFAFVVGLAALDSVPRTNSLGLREGGLGQVWRLYGKYFVYRRKIKEQIREQKRLEMQQRWDWPWRVWLS